MVGFSYGGGIPVVTAATDHRVDAIVPGIAWHTLNSSLYRDNAFRTGYALLLMLRLITTAASVDPRIYPAIISGALTGALTAEQQDPGEQRARRPRQAHHGAHPAAAGHRRRCCSRCNKPSPTPRCWTPQGFP